MSGVELVCDDCGQDYPVWFAPNQVWNLGEAERGGMECPSCFAAKYELVTGTRPAWSFVPIHQLRDLRDQARTDADHA